MKRYGKMVVFCIAVLIFSGCSNTVQKKDERITVAYISKDLEHTWFQAVSRGIQEKCEEKDAQYLAYNAEYNDDLCLDAVKDALNKGARAIMITSTNQKLGAEISKMCKEKGAMLVTIDDNMKDEEGKELPHVGMPYKELGMLGGNALVKKAKEEGFFESKKEIKILQIIVTDLSVFTERMDAFADAIFHQSNLTENNVVLIQVEKGMYEDVYKGVNDFIQEQDDMDNYWLICGANDDCAVATMHALIDNGVMQNDVIACGIGGYNLSIEEFEKKNENYIAILTQPEEEGKEAGEHVFEYLEDQKEFKGEVSIGGKVITSNNYRLYMNDEG